MGRFSSILASLALLGLASCTAVDPDPGDAEDAPFATGKADGSLAAGSPAARAVLALVNDPLVNFAELDIDAALNRRAASGIIAHRDGTDAIAGTADDDMYGDLEELDAVKYVGPRALEQLLAYATAQGYLEGEQRKRSDVVFSPMPYEQSHNVRVAELIDAAEYSVDIAMYSYSDARIAAALKRAVERGIDVRFVFHTANDDRKKTGDALYNSKSARLERIGINVRWVNKIMHHKFMIVDGPRDDGARIDTATIVSGSGNWSNGAATRYDENTLFLTGYPELTARLQREFNLLWANSRDFVFDSTLPYELSSLKIDAAGIADEASTDAVFTSANFTVSSTTFRRNGESNVAEAIVAAIGSAATSIHIASGHLRSRAISEAIMAAKAANPALDVRIYLDGQEYISSWYNNSQLSDLDECLVSAGTSAARRRACMDKGFYFGYQVGQAGIDVRYKYYAYRWHYSYAVQMHHKYIIIDGEELWTGSYNQSDNAEHNTFENVLVFRGPEFAALVGAYEQNFATMWEAGRAENLVDQLLETVATADPLPLVFQSMSLTWDEVTEVKAAIRASCADINSDDFRRRPEAHYTCRR